MDIECTSPLSFGQSVVDVWAHSGARCGLCWGAFATWVEAALPEALTAACVGSGTACCCPQGVHMRKSLRA